MTKKNRGDVGQLSGWFLNMFAVNNIFKKKDLERGLGS